MPQQRRACTLFLCLLSIVIVFLAFFKFTSELPRGIFTAYAVHRTPIYCTSLVNCGFVRLMPMLAVCLLSNSPLNDLMCLSPYLGIIPEGARWRKPLSSKYPPTTKDDHAICVDHVTYYISPTKRRSGMYGGFGLKKPLRPYFVIHITNRCAFPVAMFCFSQLQLGNKCCRWN